MADMSPADFVALSGGNEFGGSWLWIIVLFFLFGGNGFNSYNNRDYATKSDVYEGLYNNNVLSKLDSMTTQINGDFNSLQLQTCQGFNQTNMNLLQQANASNVLALQNTASLSSQIDNNRFASQQCCCEVKTAIANSDAQNYKNTCDILTAIHNDGEATRAVLVANKIADLEEKLADANRAGQTAQIEASQQAQTNALISALRPTPIPAYATCSPYQSNYYASTGCGCGLV